MRLGSESLAARRTALQVLVLAAVVLSACGALASASHHGHHHHHDYYVSSRGRLGPDGGRQEIQNDG